MNGTEENTLQVHESNVSICLYADDTNVVVTGKDRESLEISAFANLTLIKQFFDNLQLNINENKTNFICFSTKQSRAKSNPIITIDKKMLAQATDTKFLGLFTLISICVGAFM